MPLIWLRDTRERSDGGGGLRSIWSNPIGVYTVQQSDIKSRVTWLMCFKHTVGA